jgi:SAM-dependent methyltransferase
MIANLSLRDLTSRTVVPAPWSEGDNIPWDDPGFSERMLREHLCQDHDLASRRVESIEADVEWLHRVVLSSKPSRILDLACGPGLYSHRLARLGHRCVGIDFSPASVKYARREAAALVCEFVLADLRQADFGEGHDVVLLNYGQLNVFQRWQARDLVARACRALHAGGELVLEVQTDAQVRSAEGATPTWHTAEAGLFAESPHLVLHERFWDEAARTATERWYVVDAATGSVTRFALSNVAYTRGELEALLRAAGFARVEFLDGFGGGAAGSGMFGVRAVK